MIKEISCNGKGRLFEIESENIKLTVTDFGASIYRVLHKNSNQIWEDVAITFEDYNEFTENNAFLGATVGRVCNRIENSTFKINEKSYTLENNEGKNSLHGGYCSFGRRFWDVKIKENEIVFSIESPDNEGGYPGKLLMTSSYSIDDAGGIVLTHIAKSDKDTYVGTTNHAYWTIGGLHEKAKNQELKMLADFYIPVREDLIPTGEILSVNNTPYDFRGFKKIGDEHNYDTSFVKRDRGMSLAAILRDKNKGRQLTVESTLPDIHLYVGKMKSKDEKEFEGVCLEAAIFPNAPNLSHFGKCFLKAGEEYCEKIRYEIENI